MAQWFLMTHTWVLKMEPDESQEGSVFTFILIFRIFVQNSRLHLWRRQIRLTPFEGFQP